MRSSARVGLSGWRSRTPGSGTLREDSQSRSATGVAAIVACALGFLAVIELIAFAPLTDLLRPRIWIFHGFSTSVFVAIVALVATVLMRALSRWGGVAVTPAESALFVVFPIAGGIHAWPFVRSAIGGSTTSIEAMCALVLFAVLAGAGWLIAGGARVRSRSDWEVALTAGALVALPVLITTARISAHSAGEPISETSRRLVGAAYAVLLVVAFLTRRLQGGRYAGAILAIVGVTAVVLRLGTTNEHATMELSRPASNTPSGPSVVLIVLDTFRADSIDPSPPSQSRTPHLAELATQSENYGRAIANGSWTLPTHASILTGEFLHEHRTDLVAVPGFSGRVDEGKWLLQEYLAHAGYRTAAVVANPVVSRNTGLSQGFQTFHQPGRAWLYRTLPLKAAVAASPGGLIVSQLVIESTGIQQHGTAAEVVDSALRVIDEDARPFFLFLNFMDTHLPSPAPSDLGWRERLRMFRAQVAVLVGWHKPQHYFRESNELLRRYYKGQVEALDGELGRLFEGLKHRGSWDAALVIVTSDHGEAFCENELAPQYYGHHGSYEPVVRVPLLVKAPGQTVGDFSDALAQQIDITPRVLREAGVEVPPNLLGGLPPRRSVPVLTEWYPRGRHSWDLSSRRLAIYRGHYKLVLQGEDETWLYDLTTSPFEREALAGAPALAASLEQELRRHIVVTEAPASHRAEVELDAELEDSLRSLGYLR